MGIIVTGMKQHGKDTVCELLGLAWASSSWEACKLFLFDTMIANGHQYASKEDCFEDRDNHRQEWFEIIRDWCQVNGMHALGAHIFKNHDVYCGIRNIEELRALMMLDYVDIIVWVDASKRKPPESASSMTITPAYADIIIDNNGTLEDLKRNIIQIIPLLTSRLDFGHPLKFTKYFSLPC